MTSNTWPDGGCPPDPVERKRPVLIVGPPRSGTTWVEEVLGYTRGASTIHEPDNETINPFALRAKRELGRFPALAPGDEAPAELLELWSRAFTGRVHPGNVRWLAAKMLLKTAGTDLAAAFDGPDPRLSTRLRLVKSLAVPPDSGPGDPQVIVKSVHAPLAVEWIAFRWQPRVVVVRRNPFSIVSSHMDLGWQDAGLDRHPGLRRRLAELSWVPPLSSSASRLSRLTWQIGLFTAALEAAAGRHPDWHVVSHEALCRDPEAGFGDLSAELGLTWTEAASAFLVESNQPGRGLATQRVAADECDRWRRRLTVDQVDEVASVLCRFPDSVWSDRATA